MVTTMDWQIQLISLYDMVCKYYQESLWVYCQRLSPHCDLSFTDEEIITLYLFGIINKHTQILAIYSNHLQVVEFFNTPF